MKYTKTRKYVHHFDNMNQMKDQKPNTQLTIRICREPKPNQMLSDGFM